MAHGTQVIARRGLARREGQAPTATPSPKTHRRSPKVSWPISALRIPEATASAATASVRGSCQWNCALSASAPFTPAQRVMSTSGRSIPTRKSEGGKS
jgi:hypothetical protein